MSEIWDVFCDFQVLAISFLAIMFRTVCHINITHVIIGHARTRHELYSYGDFFKIWVNIVSSNGFLPDGTKPLPEPMLIYLWYSLKSSFHFLYQFEK